MTLGTETASQHHSINIVNKNENHYVSFGQYNLWNQINCQNWECKQ